MDNQLFYLMLTGFVGWLETTKKKIRKLGKINIWTRKSTWERTTKSARKCVTNKFSQPWNIKFGQKNTMVYFINKVIKTNNISTNDKSVKQKHAPARMYVSAWVSAEANFVDLCQWIQYKRIHITCSFLGFHSKTKKNARKLISLQSECYAS